MVATTSQGHLITGWKDVPAHEKWIAGDQNQELVVKFGPFLKVKGLAHLDMDFNTMPTDKQTFICEKYGQWSVAAKLTESKEDRNREAELMKGSTDVEWIGTGKDLGPEANGAFYKFTSCTDRWRDKIVASATQNKEVTVLKRVDMETLHQT
jgi:hypothetical protein